MGRCKRKTLNYCVDDETIQTTGYQKEKKIQYDVLCKDVGADCPRNKVTTALTDSFEQHYPTHPEGRVNFKRKISTCKVGMQGDSNNQRNLFKCSKRKQRHRDIEPKLKHYMHTGDIDDIKMQKHRKNNTYPRENCSCLGKIIFTDSRAQTEGMPKKNKKTEIINNKNSMKESLNVNGSENRKTDIKLELKPKHNGDKVIISNKNDKKSRISKQFNNPKQKTKMPCLCPPTGDHKFAEASKTKPTYFVYKHEKTPIEHQNNVAESKSHIGVVNIRDKLSCLCRKYSQKILPNRTTIPEYPVKPTLDERENGQSDMNKREYSPRRCSKKPIITDCTNETGDVNEPEKNSLKTQTTTKHKIPYSCEPSLLKLCFKDMIRRKLKSRRTTKISEHINRIPRNVGDQTGEPFIEIKVNANDMCVLNPDEIKNRVLDLSKNYKRKPTCICPSHKKRREEFLDKNLCADGVCHKTFRDKKTNFKCKCVKGGECTDLTCGGNNIYCSEQQGCGCNSLPIKSNDPLFEVKLDSKRMCVLNSDEIQKKIIDIEKSTNGRADGDCPGGICDAARTKNRDQFKCKCIEKKRKPGEIAECSEDTCDVYGAQYPENTHADLVYHWLSKLYNRGKNTRRSKMTRKPINTNEVRNIKSIFSSICGHIKSTPEIWTGSPHKGQKLRTRNLRINRSNIHGIHRREGLKLNVTKNHLDNCSCTACTAASKTVQNKGLLYKCKSIISCSFSGIKNGHKYTVNKTNGNFHRRNGLLVPSQRRRHTQYSYNTVTVSQGTDLPEDKEKVEDLKKVSKKDNLCVCDNICECAKAMQKAKEKELLKRFQKKKPQHKKPNTLRDKLKKRQEEEKHKRYSEADKRYQKSLKEKRKKELKRKIKLYKQEQREMKELSKQDEAHDTNCFVDFVLGILRLVFIGLKGILTVLFTIISDPEGSYRYTRLKLRNPTDTMKEMLRWAEEAWQHQKFRMNRAIKGSRTMTILKDEVIESEIYQAFAPKGKTEEERRFIDASNKRRKKRILKRQNEAIFGCRHMLLVTMRKRPCLWFYHICPNIYPQFLSARMFLINFSQMLLFCLAVVVWTPCIVCCEACRGLLCCILCTH